MKTFASIITGLGGYLVVAEALGIPPKSVSSMQSRDSVPPEHWAGLAQFATGKGHPEVTVDFLATLRRPRRHRDASSPALSGEVDAGAVPGVSVSRETPADRTTGAAA